MNLLVSEIFFSQEYIYTFITHTYILIIILLKNFNNVEILNKR